MSGDLWLTLGPVKLTTKTTMTGIFNLLDLTHNPNHLFPHTSYVWESKLSMPTWCRLYEGPLASRWLLLSVASSHGTERTEQAFWYPLLWSLTTRAPASWPPLAIIIPTTPSLNAIQLRAHPIITWGRVDKTESTATNDFELLWKVVPNTCQCMEIDQQH